MRFSVDGRIVGITIDAGTIFEAKARAEQKKQFAKACHDLGYSVEQINQSITDVTKTIADFIKSLYEEEKDGTP